MKSIAVVAAGAESALGSGRGAYCVGEPGDRAVTAIRSDATLEQAGLRRPFMARWVREMDGGDVAFALVDRAAEQLVEQLRATVPDWATLRLGIAVGTSSGAMISFCKLLRLRDLGQSIPKDLARRAPYFAPLSALTERLGIVPRERVQVLSACSSAAVAIGIACRWLELGRVDLAIAGGYDAVSVFVAAGFESLGATSATRPAPFRATRDGMALGEGAALLALMRREEQGNAPALGYIQGFGASSDCVHITAPDREGRGLARAALAALADAGVSADEIDLVSAHATATPYNDAAEANAIHAVLGERSRDVVVHPFKAVIGHTLGASAGLEVLSAMDATQRGVLPAAAGDGAADPDLGIRLLPENAPGAVRSALKLSAAFGGANAALVCGAKAGRGTPRRLRPVSLLAVGTSVEGLDVDAVLPLVRMDRQHLSRLDPFSALVVAATASAIRRLPQPLPEETGIVVGSACATLENNERFDQRLRSHGARSVEPRRFPPTSPNLPAGQCSIAYGFRGIAFMVGSGLGAAIEALVVAHDLVATSDVDHLVFVAAEHVGHVVRDTWTAAGWPTPAHGAIAAVLTAGGEHPIDRGRLSACAAAADNGLGAFERERPGWSSLSAVLARVAR